MFSSRAPLQEVIFVGRDTDGKILSRPYEEGFDVNSNNQGDCGISTVSELSDEFPPDHCSNKVAAKNHQSLLNGVMMARSSSSEDELIVMEGTMLGEDDGSAPDLTNFAMFRSMQDDMTLYLASQALGIGKPCNPNCMFKDPFPAGGSDVQGDHQTQEQSTSSNHFTMTTCKNSTTSVLSSLKRQAAANSNHTKKIRVCFPTLRSLGRIFSCLRNAPSSLPATRRVTFFRTERRRKNKKQTTV